MAEWADTARVTSESEAMKMLARSSRKVQALAKPLHKVLMEAGCESYVKTIYIGYALEGEMVAALYPHADNAELALALPEDEPGDLLIDATHLTWRTMPLAVVVKTKADVAAAANHIATACDGVRSGSHEVHRNNDVFIKSKRDSAMRGKSDRR